MADETTIDPDHPSRGASRTPPPRLALVLVHCREQPSRVGEVLLLPSGAGQGLVVGRGAARDEDPYPRGGWLRQRPGQNQPTPPLASAALSRLQLVFDQPTPSSIRVENVGRRRLRVDGQLSDAQRITVGQQLALDDEVLLLVTKRPVALPEGRAWRAHEHPFGFGEADEVGMVGESPAAWRLRDELAFAAARPLHVLIHGPTGTGKELAARAIHALSKAEAPMVARNAATLPVGLVDAELFGNLRDYPNPGMKARQGLIGAADGSTLFLDEIGELDEALQAHLLRVLDSGGEYHRLGSDEASVSQFRLIAATNRSVEALKHDLLARLTLRVTLPSLAVRREDRPLIARHLLLQAAASDGELARFVVEGPQRPTVRLALELIAALIAHPLEHGVRELSGILWRCVRASAGDTVELAPSVEAELAAVQSPSEADAHATGPAPTLSEADIRQALENHDWVVARTWSALGLPSRHALHRLMKKFGIERQP